MGSSKVFSNMGYKPLDLGCLRKILEMPDIKSLPADTKIELSADEEGNGFGVLFSVEVQKSGDKVSITLWPASY